MLLLTLRNTLSCAVDFLRGFEKLQPNLLRISLNDSTRPIDAVQDDNFRRIFHAKIDTPSSFLDTSNRA